MSTSKELSNDNVRCRGSHTPYPARRLVQYRHIATQITDTDPLTTDNEQQPGPPLSPSGTCPVVPSQLAGTLRGGLCRYLISRATWESLDFRGAWGISWTTNRVQ